MSALEGFGKKTSDKIKHATGNAARAMVIAGGLSAGVGMAEAQAQSANPYDATKITLLGLAQNQFKSPRAYQEIKRNLVTPRMMLNIALTAHSLDPKYTFLGEDQGLKSVERINPSLVLPLLKHRNINTNYWNDLKKELDVVDPTTAMVKLDILKDSVTVKAV